MWFNPVPYLRTSDPKVWYWSINCEMTFLFSTASGSSILPSSGWYGLWFGATWPWIEHMFLWCGCTLLLAYRLIHYNHFELNILDFKLIGPFQSLTNNVRKIQLLLIVQKIFSKTNRFTSLCAKLPRKLWFR